MIKVLKGLSTLGATNLLGFSDLGASCSQRREYKSPKKVYIKKGEIENGSWEEEEEAAF